MKYEVCRNNQNMLRLYFSWHVINKEICGRDWIKFDLDIQSISYLKVNVSVVYVQGFAKYISFYHIYNIIVFSIYC